jgi:hypothetical protein
MKEKVVTAVVDIQLKGEYKHFEIRIPDDVKTIDGVETSCRFHTNMLGFVKEEITAQKIFEICDVRLQGGKTNNWFYNESVSDYVGNAQHETFFYQQQNCIVPFTFHKKRESNMCTVIPQGTRIKGYIKDTIGMNLQEDIHYSITISIHLSTH